MRRPKLRLVLGIAIPLLVIALFLGAWAVDTSGANGKVPRNVTLDGRDVGELDRARLAATVADVADGYARTPVQLRVGDATAKVPAGQLGLELDQHATVAAALALDDDLSTFQRPFTWAASFLDERKAPLRFTVDRAKLAAGLAALKGNSGATEPKVVPTGDGFGIISGSPGRKVDPAGVADQLLARARSGERPIIVDANTVERAPKISDADAQAVADQLTTGTAKGLTVKAGTHTAAIPTTVVRGWVGTEARGGKLEITVDEAQVRKDLQASFPTVTKAKDASITLVNNAVQITPSTDGERCCAPDSAQRVLDAIRGGQGTVTVDLIVAKPKLTTEDAQKLGIKEPVGTTTEWKGQPQVKSFTTYYDPGAPRVTNIHRIADLVRGTIVKPGETFSVNAVVGERTVEKGFVVAGAIANGEHVEQVGGGVSQFATTTFNAAFFAGLPFVEYQAHSEHFDRYPYGREATMGFPHPDLAFKNNTPYGIMVWTSYTDTSVTVTLWSTQYAYGEQTGQSTSHSGRCTSVTTQRTIHHADGTTGTDTVRARYRDAGATSC